MAVASDLPDLENRERVPATRATPCSSTCTARSSASLTRQREPDPRPLRRDLARRCSNAIIAIEDQRFYEQRRRRPARHRRARSCQDVVQRKAVQGGSTITQQFVKNAMQAQNERTVFQKLREAALAYHLDAQVVQGEDPHAST